jgi:hypothetical protein
MITVRGPVPHKIGEELRPRCEAVAPEVRQRKRKAMVDAGEKAHALARLLQQELRDLGPRPVDWLPVVRALWTGPLLRHAAQLRCVHLQIF